jgi:hypothetical protein
MTRTYSVVGALAVGMIMSTPAVYGQALSSASPFAAFSDSRGRSSGLLPYETQLSGLSDPQAIPLADAVQIFYQMIVKMEASQPNSGVTALRTAMNLDREKAAAYVEHMTNALSSEISTRQERAGLVCDRRGAVATTEQLAAALQAADTAVEQKWLAVLRDAERVLGPGSRASIDSQLLAVRRGTSLVRADSRKWVEYQIGSGKSVAGLVSEICATKN